MKGASPRVRECQNFDTFSISSLTYEEAKALPAQVEIYEEESNRVSLEEKDPEHNL
jgi:hypothetical protein